MTTRLLSLSIKYFSAVTGTALTALLATLALPIQAATLVTDRSDLGGNDLLDWSSLGKVFNPFNPNPSAFLPNSFSTTSQQGRGLDIAIVFLGVSSDTPNISKLVYGTSVSDRAFAINTLSIAAVPEYTSTLGLLAVGALGAGSAFKRKLSRQTSTEK